MFNFKTSLKTLGAAAVLSLGAFVAMPAAPANAQTATSLNDIADRVRRDSSTLTAENQARLRRFQSARDQQAAIMAEARRELNAAEQRGRSLSSQFDANANRLDELGARLEEEAGDFGELLGQFRQAAGETTPVIAGSIANFQYPGRVEKLAEIAQANSLPSRADLDSLPKAILTEMIAQSEVTTFTTTVANGAACLLYTSPSPRDQRGSRMPSSA